MPEQSGVSWTDSSHGFWYGCRKVSQGCKFCYAERQMTNYRRDFRTVTRSKSFNKPLSWKEGRKIFVNPWSDFFIEDADDWRADAWDIIRQTPQHTYQILTKRPERIAACLPSDWRDGWPHVWLGVSAENQDEADSRIPVLLSTPARLRFVSAEPLLGPINFELYFEFVYEKKGGPRIYPGIDWIIVGGESGPQYRTMEMAWARAIRDQCVAAGVPFFFKQDADTRPERRPYIVEPDGSQTTWQQFPPPRAVEPPPARRQLSLFN